MSVTATFGPPISVDAPVPRQRRYRLLDVADVVNPDDERWTNGAALYGWPPHPGEAWDPCSVGTFREKEEGEAVPLPIFGSFTAYVPITCSSLSIGDWEEFSRRAITAFMARESAIVEHQLITADFRSANKNPHLADTNTTVITTSTGNVVDALAELEDEIGRTEQAGVIHVPPSLSTAMAGAYLVEKEDGMLVMTGTGTPVVVGAGYIDQIPEGAAALSNDQQYAWATFPLRIYRNDARVTEDISQALTRDDNIVTFRAERDYLVVFEAQHDTDWDGGLQAAVLVDRSV